MWSEALAGAVVLSLLFICISPLYSEMQQRERQAEARVNLGRIFISETAFFAEEGRYSDFDQIRVLPELTGPFRYTYRAMRTVVIKIPNRLLVYAGKVQVLKPSVGQE